MDLCVIHLGWNSEGHVRNAHAAEATVLLPSFHTSIAKKQKLKALSDRLSFIRQHLAHFGSGLPKVYHPQVTLPDTSLSARATNFDVVIRPLIFISDFRFIIRNIELADMDHLRTRDH